MTMKLIVRCAVQQKDCTYEVDASWTVLQLKEHLQLQHDGRPAASKQRIIYMGRILDDNETIKTVLSRHGISTDSEPIMHLMYTLPDNHLRLRRNASSVQQQKQQASKVEERTAPTQTSFTQSQQHNSYGDFAQVNVAYMQYMQQYQQAIMQQYSAYYASMTGTQLPQHFTAPFMNTTWSMNAMPSAPTPAPAPVAAPQPAAAAAPEAPDAVNNGAGLAMNAEQLEEEALARDVLDYVYMALRASMLLIILYYYSSTYRILAVGLIALLFWAMQRNPQQRQAAANEQQAQPQQDGNNNIANATSQEADAPTEAPVVEEPTAWQVFWGTSYSFITGFFISLLPDAGHWLDQAEPANDNNAQQQPQAVLL